MEGFRGTGVEGRDVCVTAPLLKILSARTAADPTGAGLVDNLRTSYVIWNRNF